MIFYVALSLLAGLAIIYIMFVKKFFNFFKIFVTRKYLLRGYILGVLIHTTAWGRYWGGDETLKLALIYAA